MESPTLKSRFHNAGVEIDSPLSSYVLGGTHMTNPALLVSRILKELTATEDTFYGWVATDLVRVDSGISWNILRASDDKSLARGYVNTDYLLSLTEDDAEREQKLLYRFLNNHHNYLFWAKLI